MKSLFDILEEFGSPIDDWFVESITGDRVYKLIYYTHKHYFNIFNKLLLQYTGKTVSLSFGGKDWYYVTSPLSEYKFVI